MKLAVHCCVFVFCAAFLFAQTADFSQGEELFLRNRPAEALVFLERANAADPADVTAGLYLAMSYEQLSRIDSAIAVYRRILPFGGDKTALVAYNLGNAYYSKGAAAFAEQFYTIAIEADPGYASAYLNRANTRIKTGALREAVPDYEYYLALEPKSPKRPQIERLISLIEEGSFAVERRRIAAEAAARAEAEKQQRLMDEISSTLQDAGEDSQSFSDGAEGDVQGLLDEAEEDVQSSWTGGEEVTGDDGEL